MKTGKTALVSVAVYPKQRTQQKESGMARTHIQCPACKAWLVGREGFVDHFKAAHGKPSEVESVPESAAPKTKSKWRCVTCGEELGSRRASIPHNQIKHWIPAQQLREVDTAPKVSSKVLNAPGFGMTAGWTYPLGGGGPGLGRRR